MDILSPFGLSNFQGHRWMKKERRRMRNLKLSVSPLVLVSEKFPFNLCTKTQWCMVCGGILHFSQYLSMSKFICDFKFSEVPLSNLWNSTFVPNIWQFWMRSSWKRMLKISLSCLLSLDSRSPAGTQLYCYHPFPVLSDTELVDLLSSIISSLFLLISALFLGV